VPIELQFTEDGLGVIYRCEGKLDHNHFSYANNRLLELPERIRRLRYAIVDASSMEPFYFPPSEMERIVQQDRQIASLAVPGLIVALVATQYTVLGLTRMWEAFVTGIDWNTQSFLSLSEAQTWVRLKLKERFEVDLS
jgi:hypothetical protein